MDFLIQTRRSDTETESYRLGFLFVECDDCGSILSKIQDYCPEVGRWN
jgi:uncharacterized OB-fold protein